MAPFNKLTEKDFQNSPELWAQYREAYDNANKGHIFFGSRFFRKQKENSPGFIPSTDEEIATQTLERYIDDIDQYHQQSKYYGCIFYPEITDLNTQQRGKFTPEKNMAFWAGAIDARRTFLFISSIGRLGRLTGSAIELIWLEDNGYCFQPYRYNNKQIICLPPKKTEAVLYSYHDASGKEETKLYNTKFKRLRKALMHQLRQIEETPQNKAPKQGNNKQILSTNKNAMFSARNLTITIPNLDNQFTQTAKKRIKTPTSPRAS